MSGIATAEGFVDFRVAGALAAGLVADAILMAPFDIEIADVMAYVGTAPTGANLILNFQITRVLDGSTANLYATPGTTDNRPTIDATKQWTVAEQTESFPAGSWPAPQAYALNNSQPGGSVATAPAYTGGESVLPVNPPDLNTIMLAGDILRLNVVQVGSTVAGSDLVGALHWMKR